MSASNDINVLQGNFAEDFFKKDFHADNTIASIFKSKSSEAGALKFTWNVKPGCCFSDSACKCNFETQINFKTKGNDNQSFFKIKPGKITGHFDLGTKNIEGHSFNPYVVLNFPTSYTNLKESTDLTLGSVAKFDCKAFPCTLNLNLDFVDGGINIKENWTIQKNTWSIGSLSNWGLGTDSKRSCDLLVTNKADKFKGSLKVNGISTKGVAGWTLGFLVDINKQFSLAGSWSSGKGGCPVTGNKVLGLDWHPCSHLGARVTYDRTTLGVLANVGKLFHPYLSASLCLESDIHGVSKDGVETPHRYGAKLTFNH